MEELLLRPSATKLSCLLGVRYCITIHHSTFLAFSTDLTLLLVPINLASSTSSPKLRFLEPGEVVIPIGDCGELVSSVDIFWMG